MTHDTTKAAVLFRIFPMGLHKMHLDNVADDIQVQKANIVL